jgi:phosphatidylserine/phosphatidylglycerophosphate/cardiolipin synthase-like enzyme
MLLTSPEMRQSMNRRQQRASRFTVTLAAALVLTLSFCHSAEQTAPVDAKIQDISERYFDAVHSELQKATNSIHVVMYRIALPESSAERERETRADVSIGVLLQDLVAAHERGVTVRVLLNRGYWRNTGEERSELDSGNQTAYDFLRNAGIPVFYGQPGRTLHNKVIIIDGKIAVVGSTNWTLSALARNGETSVLIQSPQYAEDLLRKINRIETIDGISFEQAVLPDSEPIPSVLVPTEFLTNKRYGPAIVTRKAEYVFDIYLLLLKRAQEEGLVAFEIDYDKMARDLGIAESKKPIEYRKEINRSLRSLAKKHKLVTYK